MIRKILKWIGIVLGSLIGLLGLAFVVLYVIGTVQWNRLHGRYEVPEETISIWSIPVSMAFIVVSQYIIRQPGESLAPPFYSGLLFAVFTIV